jgi:hypothetical protein
MPEFRCRSGIGLGMLLWVTQLHAQVNPEWTIAVDPFRIVGHPYYVGSMDLASYLIVTPKDNTLINSSLEASVRRRHDSRFKAR